MEEDNIVELAGREAVSDPLTDLLRKSARQLMQTAVEAEIEDFLGQFQDKRTPEGRAMIVRNGHQRRQPGRGADREAHSGIVSQGVCIVVVSPALRRQKRLRLK
jgi:hypothetical protein